MIHIPIDREYELGLLNSLVTGKTERRIMLIKASSGMGKTFLIRRFISQINLNPSPILIDFKYSGFTVTQLIFHICDKVGWEYFKNTKEGIQEINSPANIYLNRNTMIGHSEISIEIQAGYIPKEEIQTENLTRRFIEDLHILNQKEKKMRVALFFDTFQLCTSSVFNWLVVYFLPHVRKLSNFSVVIAGQDIPDEDLFIDSSFTIYLKEIPHEYWHVYAKSLGLSVTQDYIAGICDVLDGKCLAIAEFIRAKQGRLR